MTRTMLSIPPKVNSLCLAAASLVATTVASAHPGHYHPPGEEDEFDALRADWLHLHGGLEIGLAIVALASTVVIWKSRRGGVRIGAAAALVGSLALIAVS